MSVLWGKAFLRKVSLDLALADYLVARGALTPKQVKAALADASRWGEPISRVIRHQSLVPPERLAQLLAAFVGQDYLLETQIPRDHALVSISNVRTYLRSLAMPWHRTDDTLFVAAVDPLDFDETVFAELAENRRIVCLSVTQTAFYEALSDAVGQPFLYMATHGLEDHAPHYSARTGIWRWQWLALAVAIGAAFYGAITAPVWSFILASLITSSYFAAVMAFRIILIAAALWPGSRKRKHTNQQTDLLLTDKELPVYSVIVALHREAALLPQTVAALSKLDYPNTKLDIILVLEERDLETRRAAGQLRLDDRFKLLVVPHGHPQTKPKACNYALSFARGDFITLFDAEDRPDPQQLRKSLALFAETPELTCAQGQLAYYNAQENALTRQFALEFAVWFELVLPGLERLKLPIPLGGTSNHFRTDELVGLLGWDAHNVTEDADLGMRMARLKRKVKTLDSVTLEEANCRAGNWIHQRSRWLKGYLQTYLVHMRNPRRLMRELGIGGFIAFQLLVGSSLPAALFHGLFWSLLVLAYAGWSFLPDSPKALHDYWVWSLGIGLAGNVIAVGSGILAAARLNQRSEFGGLHNKALIYLSALTMPVYWFLSTAAALKALISFVGRPFYWAKTRHGISRIRHD